MIYHEEKQASKNFDIKGTHVISVKNPAIQVAYVPDGITDIDENAFMGCKDLRIVFLPESIDNNHHCAFRNCSELERINIPDKVEYIGELVFDGCRNLRHLYIPNSVSTLSNLGDVHLDFLRIPYRVWQGWISNSKVRDLVIGLPKYTSDFDLVPLNEFIGMTPYITIEPFEASANGYDIDGLKIIDGMIIGLTESNNEDTFESVLGVFSIPRNVLSIPYGVERICSNLSVVDYLYIPETVDEIDEDAFYMIGVRFINLVTKASNLVHLKEILPDSLSKVNIHTI